MDGFGFESRRLRQAFGSTSSGCTEQYLHLFGLQNLQNTSDNRGFADAWPPSDDGHFAVEHCRHGFTLGRREGPTGFLLDPGEGLRRINRSPGWVPVEKPEQVGG